MALIVKNNIRKVVKELDKENAVSSVAEEVGMALERKVEARKYFKKNFWRIKDALKEENLGKILHGTFIDESIGYNFFGPVKDPCEECGEKYIGGLLELGKYERLNVKELHVISKHPSTYKDEWKNLQYIGRLVDKHTNHLIKINIVPGLEDAILSYDDATEKHSKASAESYNYWESTHGGIHAEEEEIEDDPHLKEWAEEEKMIHQAEIETGKILKKKEKELNEKYRQLTGKDPTEIDWLEETISINILKYAAPSLLNGMNKEKLFQIRETQWGRSAKHF